MQVLRGPRGEFFLNPEPDFLNPEPDPDVELGPALHSAPAKGRLRIACGGGCGWDLAHMRHGTSNMRRHLNARCSINGASAGVGRNGHSPRAPPAARPTLSAARPAPAQKTYARRGPALFCCAAFYQKVHAGRGCSKRKRVF